MAVSENSNNHHDIPANNFRKKILAWYDKHRRTLPWRAFKAKKPDPYHVWLSEIMLQQTTVITVGPYFEKFIAKWPTVHDLAKAQRDEVMHEWAGLGYYARARNLHKCAQVVSDELNGKFPQTQDELKKLPGIGEYTSAAIAAIAFDKPANVVDGNIERIMARLFAVTEPLPDSKKELKRLAGALSENREDRPGDYAQALMDLGATICTPKSPKCILCPVQNTCLARQKGILESLPVKKPKGEKPQKHGHVLWISNDNDEVLFIRRDEKEMLGGMLALPTTEWIKTSEKRKKPRGYKSTKLAVFHSFTHFDLKLDIYVADTQKDIILPENNPIWVASSKIEELGLPTLFSKVVKLMK
jgi:A/G-specific adenine glycosylase